MVLAAGVGPIDSLESGVHATLRLIADPVLDGVTGRYFDHLPEGARQAAGLRPGRAGAQCEAMEQASSSQSAERGRGHGSMPPVKNVRSVAHPLFLTRSLRVGEVLWQPEP